MFVYAPHKKSTHTMFVAPAADPGMKSQGEMPGEWVDDNNKPLNFEVEFVRGKAEVDDKLGKYLIDRGLARKSKIILPQDDD